MARATYICGPTPIGGYCPWCGARIAQFGWSAPECFADCGWDAGWVTGPCYEDGEFYPAAAEDFRLSLPGG